MPPTVTQDQPGMSDMEAQLRQAAHDSDEGKAVDLSSLEAAAAAETSREKQTNEDGTTPDSTTTATDTGSAKGNGQPVKKDQAEKQEAGKTGAKPDSQSEYAKKQQEREQKERERQDRTWEKLNQRRAELEEREAELRRLEQGKAPTSPAAGRTNEPARDSDGYSAADWDNAAKAWEREGKIDLADMARDKAKDVRESARTAPTQTASTAPRESTSRPEETPGTPQFVGKWKEHLVELASENPDLKNPQSELYQATAAVLKSDPRFQRFNDGIVHAFRIAQLELKASKAETLAKQVEEQNKELGKLHQATAPGAGGAESSSKSKSFEEMTTAEQEKHLARLAAEAD